MKIQTVKIKLDIIALIIAGLAMIGTVANSCFNWWDHLQRERVLFDVTCEPVLNEPVEFRQMLYAGVEHLIFFNECIVTNIGSKKVYITSILSYGGHGVYVYEGSGGGRPGGSRAYGTTPSSKFTPDDTRVVYKYDEGTKNLKSFTLPLAVDGGEQVTFFVKMELPIGQEMIKKFNTTCPDRLKRKITFVEFFEGCMNERVVYSYPDFHITPNIKPKNVLYEITPDVTIYTAAGFSFNAKTPTIYIVKKD